MPTGKGEGWWEEGAYMKEGTKNSFKRFQWRKFSQTDSSLIFATTRINRFWFLVSWIPRMNEEVVGEGDKNRQHPNCPKPPLLIMLLPHQNSETLLNWQSFSILLLDRTHLKYLSFVGCQISLHSSLRFVKKNPRGSMVTTEAKYHVLSNQYNYTIWYLIRDQNHLLTQHWVRWYLEIFWAVYHFDPQVAAIPGWWWGAWIA